MASGASTREIKRGWKKDLRWVRVAAGFCGGTERGPGSRRSWRPGTGERLVWWSSEAETGTSYSACAEEDDE